MADFRSVQTRMWREDEWFASLPVAGKLLWVWMQTNDQAEKRWQTKPVRTIARETGIDEFLVSKLIVEFKEAQRLELSDGRQAFRIFLSDTRCVNCGAGFDMTIDHIKPRSWGGSSDPDNLQWLCRHCNSSKGNRHDTRY